MNVRLLAIDLDGTLLTSDKRIQEDSIAAIRKAQEMGVTVVLASGRIRPSLRPFAELLGLQAGPAICGNGTHVVLSAEEDMYRLHLDEETVKVVVQYALDSDVHMNLYTHDRLFFLRDTPWGNLYKKRVETVAPELLNGSFSGMQCLKVIIVDNPDKISGHSATLLAKIANVKVRATESEAEYLEFMDAGATKGLALRQLAERLGIDQSETAAIGDYLNDLEMVQYASLSAAVGNAHPALKAAANVVVSSNEEGGVSEFIREFVLKQQ